MKRWAAFAAAAAAVLAMPAAMAQEAVLVTVVRVPDGDTVTVRGWPQNVRLASIDAPEVSHGRRRPGQPFGQASRDMLASLVMDREVLATCYERDHNNRPVCDLRAAGVNVGKAMVQAGMAWAQQKRYLRDRELLQDQRAARAAGMGLWREAEPVPPWEWRRTQWSGD